MADVHADVDECPRPAVQEALHAFEEPHLDHPEMFPAGAELQRYTERSTRQASAHREVRPPQHAASMKCAGGAGECAIQQPVRLERQLPFARIVPCHW